MLNRVFSHCEFDRTSDNIEHVHVHVDIVDIHQIILIENFDPRVLFFHDEVENVTGYALHDPDLANLFLEARSLGCMLPMVHPPGLVAMCLCNRLDARV